MRISTLLPILLMPLIPANPCLSMQSPERRAGQARREELQEPKIDIEFLKELYIQRELDAPGLDAAWTTTHIMFPSSEKGTEMGIGSGVNTTAEPVTLTSEWRLRKKGSKVRIDANRQVWHNSLQTIAGVSREVLVDASGVRTLLNPLLESASIQKSRDGPVINAIREAVVQSHLSRWVMQSSVQILRTEESGDGRNRLIVVGNTDYNDIDPGKVGGLTGKVGGLTRLEYYLDPDNEYLPVRRVGMYPSGLIRSDIEMQYDDGEPGELPLLSSLVATIYDRLGENLRDIYRIEVQSMQLDAPISDDIFDLIIPQGYYVTDRITGRNYIKREKTRRAKRGLTKYSRDITK